MGDLQECMVRKCKKLYTAELPVCLKPNNISEITTLPMEEGGRSLFLGGSLDCDVQKYIQAPRQVGATVSGSPCLTRGWAASLLKRIGFVK